MKMKPIPGFSDYEITNDGQVWSKPRITPHGHQQGGKWLRPEHTKDGYYRVCLRRDGESCKRRVHRLILETYVGPCPPGMEACHNNGIKTDNRVENLRWDSHAANQLDAVRHGTLPGFQARGEAHGRAKLTEVMVRGIMALWQTRLFTRREIAERYGVDRATIGGIVVGRTWRHLWFDVNAVEVLPRRATG